MSIARARVAGSSPSRKTGTSPCVWILSLGWNTSVREPNVPELMYSVLFSESSTSFEQTSIAHPRPPSPIFGYLYPSCSSQEHNLLARSSAPASRHLIVFECSGLAVSLYKRTTQRRARHIFIPPSSQISNADLKSLICFIGGLHSSYGNTLTGDRHTYWLTYNTSATTESGNDKCGEE
ncbi:hypothetical protein OE88DRAFT_1510057 [Heliocybe sulcata]|uniref:Uncharacterized protein n=1 Tax=Heliocybe sulcata TaxID=5364 RepID=A0A5C3N0N9_9AGAM|nr:hypothetical protein OE88DRAFT_1510057 [Heliocybe sulcata]